MPKKPHMSDRIARSHYELGKLTAWLKDQGCENAAAHVQWIKNMLKEEINLRHNQNRG